jgi:hypothetical protein
MRACFASPGLNDRYLASQKTLSLVFDKPEIMFDVLLRKKYYGLLCKPYDVRYLLCINIIACFVSLEKNIHCFAS